MFKKFTSAALACITALSLTACSSGAASATASATSKASATSITLWTYPIGQWGDEASVKKLTDAFTADTGISVTVEYLTYKDGDDKVNTALSANQAPDLIMEGPERLVANWGAKGYMADLSDIMDSTSSKEIYSSVLSACKNDKGAVYEYPLVMTAHCMAVNVDAFKAAGADQYLDLKTHTWTTENFTKAMAAMASYYGGETVGTVYCAGQGGDQGTRALVNNLYGGEFTKADHSGYTWDSDANVKALTALYNMGGIKFDSSLVGGDEISLFYNETLKVAFCWNIAQQLDPNAAGTGTGKTINGQEIAFMSFPSETGTSKLAGGIWGFGVFDNKDESRTAAAKQFITWMANSSHTEDAVKTAKYFPVRDSVQGTDISKMWSDNQTMQDYSVLMQYLGDYYQVTKGWASARTAWWNMLQEIGTGADVKATVTKYNTQANEAAAKE
jgi:multiple sugar transport system substrate-binding protein